jgi:2-alkyl-3-oxoalkanoate reductase
MQKGYRVRGLAPKLEEIGIECVRGSATDAVLCQQAAKGVVAIVHTAAIAGVWGPAEEYESINIDATDHLLHAAVSNSVTAFVYTSSPSVTFDGSPQTNIDETAPYPSQWLCHYPRTKAIAEQHVLDANSSKLSTCSLRPHLIWGKGDPHLIPRVIDRARKGRLLRVGSGRNLIDTVHVSAAAQSHVLALERMLQHDGAASGRPYFITDGQPVPCWDWITDILSFANLKPPRRTLSLSTAYRLGATLEFFFRLARIRAEPPMTRFVAKQLGVDHFFNISEARNRLGYQPPTHRQELVNELVGTYDSSFEALD